MSRFSISLSITATKWHKISKNFHHLKTERNKKNFQLKKLDSVKIVS